MATKTVGVRLDAEMQARLKAIAVRQARTPHYLMKEAVEKFIHQAEEQENELALLRERRDYYEITGESISHEEMKEWAKGLKSRYLSQ